MSGKGSLWVVGSLNCDITVHVDRLPRAGETVLGAAGTLSAGGKGLNQAVAASRAGADVCIIGLIGEDEFGDLLLRHAQSTGLDCTMLQRQPAVPSGFATITVDSDGTNCIAVAPGANWYLSPSAIDAAADALPDAGALLVQLETPMATVEHALRVAREGGMVTIVNPAPADRALLALGALIDFITPNENELALLSGVELDGTDTSLRSAMAILVDNGIGNVVVTLGAAGCAALFAGNLQRYRAFETPVIDTTGAGDTFSGVFAAGLVQGNSAHEALRMANAAAAISVSRPLAENAAPSADEIAAFLEQAKFAPESAL